uniref:Lysophospholipid acyltransferase 5 n=1 Tax=Phallusia mammillata TaxID=59560 RepID=A0A6F9DJ49_9ASCI|nr:lysophospholipid acyltransferase 5 [Phallusia mammillata]
MSYVKYLADSLGTSENGLKLLITVYSGYLMALIHRQFPYKKYVSLQYLLFTISSLLFLYWSYGWGLLHSATCIIIQWLFFQIFRGSTVCVIISFIFQLGYLVGGYIILDSKTDYEVSWSMPHCILTLRLIGLAYDVYDGHRNEEKLWGDQKERAIKDLPSLLEMFGFSYFYGGYIVGPQFPLQRFRAMINGELTDVPGSKPNSIIPGFRRGISGTLMLGIQTYLSLTFNPPFYTTTQFQTSSFLYKIGYAAVTGHVTLLQYISIWMINEGACILCGLGYHEDKKTNTVRWDAVRNVTLHKFLLACSFQDIIDSFNINTNGWVLRYVFKRLRFVGIRAVSQGAALSFLAIWHGIHSGYFTCFIYEFLTMSVEKPLIALLHESALVNRLRSSSVLFWVPKAVGFVYLHTLLGYCLIDFSLLKSHRYLPVYMSIYFYGHVFYMTFWILLKIHNATMKPKGKSE